MFDDMQFYASISLVDKKAIPLQQKRGHQQYADGHLSGRITGVFETIQPLHVGTGLFVPPESIGIKSDVPLVKSFYQIDGRHTIPGASFKGSVRSLVEAMTYSCVSKTKSKLDKERHQECQYSSQHHRGNLCPACQIFGAMGYQGQVAFADSPLITGESAIHQIPPQYQPKGNQERRYYPHQLIDERERIWPLEVVLPGARFGLTVEFENLTQADLGVVLIALGQGHSPLCIKLGAGKSSGLGTIRFIELQAEQIDVKKLYMQLDSSLAWENVDVEACVSQSSTLLRNDEGVEQLWAELDCSNL